MIKHNVETLTHDGARRQFGLHFIKTGVIARGHGRLYSKLFDFRQKGDYGDFFDFEETTVKPLIPEVEKFLLEIKNLLK